MNVIYALVHPVSLDIRYIGKTMRSLGTRLSAHMSDAQRVNKTYLHNWINSLPSKPLIVVIEEEPADLSEAEKYWIALFRAADIRLVNGTAGGDGWVLGQKHRPESRLKMSEWQRGRKMPREGVEKQAAALRGRKASPETKAKLSAAKRGTTWKTGKPAWNRGMRMSDDIRSRMAEGRIGLKFADSHKEAIAKGSTNMWAKRTLEERIEIGRKISETKRAKHATA